MDAPLRLRSLRHPELTMQAIDLDDLESLRVWKNAHRQSFFFKGVISPDDQRRWFDSFQNRPDDHMLMIWLNGERIGCIGFRFEDAAVDVYNVILGEQVHRGQGWMREALGITCSYARARYPGAPVGVKVLKSNPAVAWYLRNGFVERRSCDEHVELILNDNVEPLGWTS